MALKTHDELIRERDDRVRKFKRMPLLLMIAGALPFITVNVWLVLGTLIALLSLYNQYLAYTSIKPADPDERYIAQAPKDTDITSQLLFGYGTELRAYQDQRSHFIGEHFSSQASSQAEASYVESVIPRMVPIHLSDDLMTRHIALIGSTGVGKTEAVLNLIYQSVARGGGAMVLNAKGDIGFVQRVSQILKQFNREDDLRLVSFDHVDLSHSYNPVMGAGKNVRQTLSTLMKLNAETKEEYFRDQNRAALAAFLVCLTSQPNDPAYNFKDLAVLANDPAEVYRLFETMKDSTRDDTAAREFVWNWLKSWVINNRDGDPEFNFSKYRETLRGLATKMSDLTHSEYEKLLCSYNPDIELFEDILSNKVIIFSLPSLADKEGLVLFAQVMLADLGRAVAEMEIKGVKPMKPFPIVLEEYGSFKDASHQELWQLARTANMCLVMAIQGRGFLDDESEVFGNNLLSNSWNQLFLYSNDPSTQEHCAKIAGTTVRRYKQASTGKNISQSAKAYEVGGLVTEVMADTISDGFKEMPEDLIRAEDFSYMDKGDAILVGVKGVYRMRLPILKFESEPPTLEKLSMQAIERPNRQGLDLSGKSYRRSKNVREKLSAQLRQMG